MIYENWYAKVDVNITIDMTLIYQSQCIYYIYHGPKIWLRLINNMLKFKVMFWSK
jgi:hypothetical protein